MKHGEVWLVDFSPNIGAEIGKRRPAIVVSNNAIGKLPLKLVVPVTEPNAKKQRWHIKLSPSKENGLSKMCFADCFQIKSISQKRFLKKLGNLTENEISDIKVGLVLTLDLI